MRGALLEFILTQPRLALMNYSNPTSIRSRQDFLFLSIVLARYRQTPWHNAQRRCPFSYSLEKGKINSLEICTVDCHLIVCSNLSPKPKPLMSG